VIALLALICGALVMAVAGLLITSRNNPSSTSQQAATPQAAALPCGTRDPIGTTAAAGHHPGSR
jgi:hypothetical protein